MQLVKSLALDPAMFSLIETDTHYMIAIDLPTVPATAAQIVSAPHELLVEGISEENQERLTVFRLLSDNKDVKVTYQNGALWLTLPKIKKENTDRPAFAV